MAGDWCDDPNLKRYTTWINRIAYFSDIREVLKERDASNFEYSEIDYDLANSFDISIEDLFAHVFCNKTFTRMEKCLIT